VLALIVFPIGAAISLWNARLVLGSRRRRWAKLWAVVLAVSCLAILWAAAVLPPDGLQRELLMHITARRQRAACRIPQSSRSNA
jgi:hypothetical protein